MQIRVVTVSHATGAGGPAIAHTVAARLGFRYIDEDIITVAAQKEGVDAALVADTERRKTFIERLIAGLAQAVSPAAIGGGTLVPDGQLVDGSSAGERRIRERRQGETKPSGGSMIGAGPSAQAS